MGLDCRLRKEEKMAEEKNDFGTSQLEEIHKSMRIPKNIRASLTIIGFSIIDLGVVGAGAVLAVQLAAQFSVPFWLKALTIISMPVFALMLVMRTPLQPKTRNWRVLVCALTEDKKKYYPLLVERKKNNVWNR